MYLAKNHIDEICNEINYAKSSMINETKGEHSLRPGDVLIRKAFDSFIEKYNDDI